VPYYPTVRWGALDEPFCKSLERLEVVTHRRLAQFKLGCQLSHR
jgi:hypothetical protein